MNALRNKKTLWNRTEIRDNRPGEDKEAWTQTINGAWSRTISEEGSLGNYTTKPGAEMGVAGGSTFDWYISTGAKYR